MDQDTASRTSRRAFLRTSSAAVMTGALASPLGMPAILGGEPAGGKLRIGLISAATYGYMGAPRTPGSNHGTAFATACNGYDEAKRKQFEGTFVAAKKRIDGVPRWSRSGTRSRRRPSGWPTFAASPRSATAPTNVPRAWTRWPSWTTAPASSGNTR